MNTLTDIALVIIVICIIKFALAYIDFWALQNARRMGRDKMENWIRIHNKLNRKNDWRVKW